MINRIRSPYSVSALAQVIGQIVLEEKDYLAGVAAQVMKDREALFEGLGGLRDKYPGQIEFMPSTGNFFYTHIKDSAEVDEALKEKGILVRDFPDANFTRITVGTTEENAALLAALDIIFKKRC